MAWSNAFGALAPNSLVVPISAEFERTWTRVLPTATLRYNIMPSQNVYARFATGYRPGGFNVGISGDFPNAEKLIPYNPEYVYGGELGWKADLLGGALAINFAGYYTLTKGALVVTSVSNNPGFILQNVGDNHIYGAELEARGRIKLGFGRLDLNAGLSTSNGGFSNGATVLDNTGQVIDISGNRVGRTRDLTATVGAALSIPLANEVSARLGANMQSEIGGYFEANNSTRLEDFVLFDVTAQLRVKNWNFSAFVRNIGDRVYLLQTVTSNAFFNTPRRYGASVRVAF